MTTLKSQFAAAVLVAMLNGIPAVADDQIGFDGVYGPAPANQEPAVDGSQQATPDPQTGFERFRDRVSVDYFNIFYGPSVQKPSSLQPSPQGEFLEGNPLLLKNYLTLGYRPWNNTIVSGTAYWTWVPVRGHKLQIQDPYVRLARENLINMDHFNLYADVRAHFAVTPNSRENDLWTGFQTFQIATFSFGRWTFGTYSSARGNLFGDEGWGNDLELYLGPNLAYQITNTVAFTLLYEMGMSHRFGDKPFDFVSDGTDLEPGVSWSITPNLLINPYLNIYVGDKISGESTALGMTLSWKLL